jgi:hypothetical protein
MTTLNAEWKDVKGFENLYEVQESVERTFLAAREVKKHQHHPK